jgi:hypothetical protein
MSDDDIELLAWAWLESMVSAISDEEPSDVAYSADQMVDAFIAGMHRAKGGAA